MKRGASPSLKVTPIFPKEILKGSQLPPTPGTPPPPLKDKKLSHVNRGASSTKPVDGAGGAAGLDTMAEAAMASWMGGRLGGGV